jgi:DivIVA domain-containing protein
MSRTEPPRGDASPEDLRRKNFTVRLRGVDQDEVRSFLTGVADQIDRLRAQTATLSQEKQNLTLQNQALTKQLQSLYAALEEARADPKEQATDQAVSILNQAQQLADSLIDEAMQSSRDLLLTARSQQRDVMEQAKATAKGAVDRATAVEQRVSSQEAPIQDVEYIRMFAKVAQVHFQAVLDALDEQLHHLGEVPEVAKRPKFG